MSGYGLLPRLFGLDDEGWRRHASPLSGWTRIATAPVLFLALWSLHWIGWWALVPIGIVGVWLVLNPRLFPPPAHYDAWVSRAVLGERIWTGTPRASLPEKHRRFPSWLTWAAIPGVGVMAAGLWRADPVLAIAGYGAAILFKLWFLDRMVWLFDDCVAAGKDAPGAVATQAAAAR